VSLSPWLTGQPVGTVDGLMIDLPWRAGEVALIVELTDLRDACDALLWLEGFTDLAPYWFTFASPAYFHFTDADDGFMVQMRCGGNARIPAH
jgi:hypothetical protein